MTTGESTIEALWCNRRLTGC